jgi:flagellar biosynthetic protein FlhB
MSDAPERESKTEEPTEKKIRDSVEKGKIPVSREASIFSSMIALLIILSFLTVDSVRQLTSTLGRLMDDPSGIRIRNGADAVEFLTLIGASLAKFLLPIVIVLAIAGLAASFLQNAPQTRGRRPHRAGEGAGSDRAEDQGTRRAEQCSWKTRCSRDRCTMPPSSIT